jgi:hypothetical protein
LIFKCTRVISLTRASWRGLGVSNEKKGFHNDKRSD